MATPNGIFVDCGSSSETAEPGIRRLNSAASKCAMFKSVSFSRPFQTTTASAITPATREQLPRAETGSQGTRELPVARAEAAKQHERQQQPQTQQRAEQRVFQSRPAVENRVEHEPDNQARHRKPVRNPPVTPVENARRQRDQSRRNPWRGSEPDCRRQMVALRGFRFQYFRAFVVDTQGGSCQVPVLSCQFSVLSRTRRIGFY